VGSNGSRLSAARVHWAPMVRILLSLSVVLVLLAGTAAACGGDSPPGSAFEELGKITAIQPARPVLVFVYTDG